MHRTFVAVVLAGMLLVPCGAGAYEGGPVQHGGTIAGVVRYAGQAPAPAPVQVTKDEAVCGKVPKTTEDLLVGADGALRNVVVFIQKIARGKEARPGKATLDNADCRYEPHVQAVLVGTELHVKNSDPILHNTHIVLPDSDVFNYALPRKGQVIKKRLRRPGLMKVGCDAGHTWMRAYIAVFDHPYFAVTGPDGRFSLDDVPPGKYTVVFWHEKLGAQKRTVTVAPDGEVTLDVTYR